MKNIFIILITLLLCSCISTTDPFVSPTLTDQNTSVEDKLLLSNGKKITLNEPESFYDAKEFLNRYIELIESAEDYILISTFLGSGCDGLDELYKAIENKARSGVKVYFIMDAISSLDMTISKNYMYPLYYLKESGVRLVEYSPVSALRLIAPQNILIRDHRKLVVIDGKLAILGGMNMNYVSLGSDNVKDLQKDSMYVFSSCSLASALIDEFITIWNQNCVSEKLSKSDFKTYEDSGDIAAYLFNQGPGTDQSMASMFSSLINSAKEEIILLPYLPFLDDNMEKALTSAIERGVKITMVLPGDSRGYAEAGIVFVYDKLVNMGIDIYYSDPNVEYDFSLIHQKLAIVDKKYTVIGSSNFNYRSMRSSFEIALVLTSEEFASKSIKQYESLRDILKLLTLEDAIYLKKSKGNYFNYLFSYYGG